MGIEIERRFLVAGPGWTASASGVRALSQAYLAATPAAAIRVRTEGDTAAWLTVKSGNAGLVRAEFEYEIPGRGCAPAL